MRRILGTLLLLLGLVGCGEDLGPTATDRAPEVVALVSETAAGGRVSLDATQLTSGSLETFTRQFTSRDLVDEVTAEAAQTEGSGQVYGAVVAVGCDVPPGVSVAADGDGWRITPEAVTSPRGECYAPVTTVALVRVPA